MKTNVISGSMIAAAAIALALTGATVAPAQANHRHHHMWGKSGCKHKAVCKSRMMRHHKGHCAGKAHCHQM